jgi:four helix bundle protein
LWTNYQTEEVRISSVINSGRCASAVAANYRAACRARSHAEFISKIAIVEEKADESVFWLDITIETKNSTEEKVATLLSEARELTAIFTSSNKTAKANERKV